MILKNKALQIFEFLAAPSERLYERAARFHLKGLLEVLDGKEEYSGEKTQTFQYFPEVAATLGAKALANPALSAAIKTDPFAAFRLLLSTYKDLAPVLEKSVLNSGEATYYFLKVAKEKNIPLTQTPDTYTQALLGDPFWALRTWGDVKEDTLLRHCLHLAKTQKEKIPGAAYLHLYFTPDADPTDFVELLSTSPMYAYLASRHFYDRNIEFKYFDLRGLTPRWAYHFITDGFLDDEDGLIDTMLGSVDWLVEYLVESERYKDLAYMTPLMERAIKKTSGTLMATYLKMWWERTQEHVKKLPPPKPLKAPGPVKAEEKK